MKAIVTGARGTVGTALCKQLQLAGHDAISWDRNKVPIDDYQAMESFVRDSGADTIFHLAIASKPTGLENEGFLVGQHWTGELAWIARELKLSFVYASTVMVFTNNLPGPYTPDMVPDETEGYGFDKRQAELRTMAQYPDAKVARLGWQIGHAPGSNNMIDFLDKQMAENGVIQASTRWLPATSFLEDTADALIAISQMPSGTYHINSNASWSFFDIVTALNELHGGRWKIEAIEDFVYDQRLLDPRVPIRLLDATLVLPALEATGGGSQTC